jgi:hypothetical protein
MAEVSVSRAIASLRAELETAIAEGQGKDLHFALENIELELTIALSDTVEGNASVTLWQVLSLGAKASANKANTHRLLLNLKPRLAGHSGDVEIESHVRQRPT